MQKILSIILCFFVFGASAQKVHFESDIYSFPANAENFSSEDWSKSTFNNKKYAVVQFSKSTSKAEREIIQMQTGILFFDYIPRYAFIASIPSGINSLAQYSIKSVTPYKGEYKMNHQLVERPLPEWTKLSGNKIQIDVTFQDDIYKSMIEYQLGTLGIEIQSWQEENLAVVTLSESQLSTLSNKAFVKYMQPTSAPGVIENDDSRSSHRTNVLDADYLAGSHYIGNGIAVSMGDDGGVGPHIDFQGRLNDLSTSNAAANTHGDHVLGTVGSAGNQDPVARGNAAGADLVVYNGYGNLNNATADYAAQGVRITTNSLGQGCNSGYNNNARTQDQRINGNFSLMSVHSSGNSGTSSCGFVNGYYVITGGYKAGKNCLATGNLVKNDVLANSSSRGPARDGRIKPDLCAVGSSVYSTAPGNTYSVKTGTSMAAPGLAGTLASLWEAYKVKNAGADPYSAVMKGIALNTADDLGRPGPDFQYGWGRINSRRALQVIDSNYFVLDTIMNGATNNFNVTVPPNMGQVKFMIYWHDPAGAANAAIPLVNDLNMVAIAPNTFNFQPWVLDYTQNAAALSANAVRGRDSVNNAEQVTVKNPQPGVWNIQVEGYDVPSGPQTYVLVYYFEEKGITLTYPQGGEHFNAGQTERVRWDANDINTPITLEYSSDAGVNWNTISSTIPSDQRYFDWTPPAALATGEMQMRVSRGTEMDVTDTNFTVYQQVQNVSVDTACPNQFHLRWDAVAGATDYTVYQLGNKFMDPVGNSTTNSIILNTNVNITNTFYFAVRANIATNGAQGRRSLAYQKQPGQINCGDDLVNLRTELPFYTANDCAPLSGIPVTMTIRNQSLTGAIISNIPVSFDVNGITQATEIISGPIQVGDSVVYTFLNTAILGPAGNYNIRTRSSHQLDGFNQNDTSSRNIVVTSVPIVVPPLVQDFEGSYVPLNWRVLNSDNNVPWQKTFVFSGAVNGNSHAAYMDFYNYGAKGEQDMLESPVVDLMNVNASATVDMTFDVSYSQRPGTEDRLQVLVSEDCGQTWLNTGYDKAGGSLATTVSSSSIFSPTLTGEWRNESISLTPYIGKEVLVRFIGHNDNGNNLYLDNINVIVNNPLSVGNYENNKYTMYPNPSDGKYVLKTQLDRSTDLYYSVSDLSGKIITKAKLGLQAGITHSALDITYLPNGIYVLELFDGKTSEVIRLTKK